MPGTRRRKKMLLATMILTACVVSLLLWDSHTNPKNTVGEVLLDNSAPEAQLAALQPYVQLEDSIAEVAAKLNLEQSQVPQPPLRRPTQHSIGLDGVNLELALRTDGTVAGIGKHVHGGESSGPVWLAGFGDDWWEVRRSH